jgi:hypothetical protein
MPDFNVHCLEGPAPPGPNEDGAAAFAEASAGQGGRPSNYATV